jgi:hypothetical protein
MPPRGHPSRDGGGQRRGYIESQTLPRLGVVKIYFQPNVNLEAAPAQATAVPQTILRRTSPGTVPPFIVSHNASSVPIIQLALSGRTLSEAQLYYGTVSTASVSRSPRSRASRSRCHVNLSHLVWQFSRRTG